MLPRRALHSIFDGAVMNLDNDAAAIAAEDGVPDGEYGLLALVTHAFEALPPRFEASPLSADCEDRCAGAVHQHNLLGGSNGVAAVVRIDTENDLTSVSLASKPSPEEKSDIFYTKSPPSSPSPSIEEKERLIEALPFLLLKPTAYVELERKRWVPQGTSRAVIRGGVPSLLPVAASRTAPPVPLFEKRGQLRRKVEPSGCRILGITVTMRS